MCFCYFGLKFFIFSVIVYYQFRYKSTAERKNDVSRRADGERRISAFLRRVHGQYTENTSFFIPAPRYVVLHPRAEIRRSSCSCRDTSFFIRALRYVGLPPRAGRCPRVVLHPRAEIRSSSSQSSKY